MLLTAPIWTDHCQNSILLINCVLLWREMNLDRFLQRPWCHHQKGGSWASRISGTTRTAWTWRRPPPLRLPKSHSPLLLLLQLLKYYFIFNRELWLSKIRFYFFSINKCSVQLNYCRVRFFLFLNRKTYSGFGDWN